MTERAAIGFWTQVEGQKGLDIHVVSDLDDDEFDRYLGAVAAYRAVTERNVYQLLHRDWRRLRSMRAMYNNLERIGGSFRAVDARSVVGLFMGEVTHWLAATRLYLESERDSIARLFGSGSPQAKRFTDARHGVFDANEGYRFLYSLRDYSQHCGPPLGGLTVSSSSHGSRSVELYLSRSDLLLARFDWKWHAKALLEQWDEQVLLMPLIEQAMSGFRQIEDEVLAMLIERCGDALPLLREGIERAAVKGDGYASIFRLPSTDEDGQIAWQSFPSSSDLDRVEAAVKTGTPAGAIRQPLEDPLSQRSPELRHAEDQAAAVIGTWVQHGPGERLTQAVNRIVQEDADVTPLISGLASLSTYLLSMLSISLGTTSEALLGGFVSTDRPSVIDGDESTS